MFARGLSTRFLHSRQELTVETVLKPLDDFGVGDRLHVCCAAQSITFQIDDAVTAEELCVDVATNTGLCPLCQGRFGLFDPKTGRWQAGDQRVAAIGVTRLEYRDKTRPCKFTFPDGSGAVVRIDESWTTQQVIAHLAKKLKLSAPDTLGLVVMSDYRLPSRLLESSRDAGAPEVSLYVNSRAPKQQANSHLEPPTSPRTRFGRVSGRALTKSRPTPQRSPVPSSPNRRRQQLSPAGSEDRTKKRWKGMQGGGASTSIRRQAASKRFKKGIQAKGGGMNMMRLNVPWLDKDLQLTEQRVGEHDQLLLQQRFVRKLPYATANAAEKALIFAHARMTFLTGQLLCSEEQLVQFSSLLIQLRYGDATRGLVSDKKIRHDSAFCLPPKRKVNRRLLRVLREQHASLTGLSSDEVRQQFLLKWQEAEEDGYDIFSCNLLKSKNKQSVAVVGVSPKDIVLATRKTIRSYHLDELKECRGVPTHAALVVLEFRKHKWELDLRDFAEVFLETVKQLKADAKQDAGPQSWLMKRPSIPNVTRTSSLRLLGDAEFKRVLHDAMAEEPTAPMDEYEAETMLG